MSSSGSPLTSPYLQFRDDAPVRAGRGSSADRHRSEGIAAISRTAGVREAKRPVVPGGVDDSYRHGVPYRASRLPGTVNRSVTERLPGRKPRRRNFDGRAHTTCEPRRSCSITVHELYAGVTPTFDHVDFAVKPSPSRDD